MFTKFKKLILYERDFYIKHFLQFLDHDKYGNYDELALLAISY